MAQGYDRMDVADGAAGGSGGAAGLTALRDNLSQALPSLMEQRFGYAMALIGVLLIYVLKRSSAQLAAARRKVLASVREVNRTKLSEENWMSFSSYT